MWQYSQSTGYLIAENGTRYGPGYSGHGPGVNAPDLQDVKNVGPIPQGSYRILAPIDTVAHGHWFMALEPDPANEMFGRSGFGCHGDEVLHPGEELASDGCIILPLAIRQIIWQSNDHQLQVIA